ncbi:biopolymer transporter ExbD [Winogradskyella sp. J14-2]|uniref:biopolymer transporter ExbD n=1 Tax=Winogradskyella sp. J14-2 TaxID=1936080 RepID=UPI000972BE67|nr:biopolymer transporter ExbD [Winogradskyella sp. J14-2]APY07069.1 biopolymer transporter ExbD [Winogradskyella sp. J14-2]
MKSFRRHSATVNAGSMADIAFLLLIFFLLTTTISADKGILRQLPSDCPNIKDCKDNINERNILRISLNGKQEIFIEDQVVQLKDVKTIVKAFVDNNGGADCDYCAGEKRSISSDHPKKAVISLSHDALTKYQLFISVQDEITKAYYDLRAQYIKHKFNKTPSEITDEEFKAVKKAYPFIVSEVMVKRN